jgi:hypothetical protein
MTSDLLNITQTFGNFREILPPRHDYLLLGIASGSHSIRERWRNNKLSADFVANYLSSFLPSENDINSTRRRRAELRNSVSYVANEILENAVKYNQDDTGYPIRFGIHLIGIEESNEFTVLISATNSLSFPMQKKYQEFIEKLLNSDTEELYIRQLEENVERGSNTSGLGLLTTINDYEAKLGWKFEMVQPNPQVIVVTTMAQIQV